MFTSLKNECHHIIATVVNYIFSGGEPLIQAAFFDETRLNFETDDYGRTDSGLACPSFREKGRARADKYSTLVVYGFTEGVIQAIPVAGTLTAGLVTGIIENQVFSLLPRNSFLIADNASVHNEVPFAY